MNVRTVGALLFGVTTTCMSQAALVDRGGGLIYDTDANLTWLQDWSLARNSSIPGMLPQGAMTWDAANNWASALVFAGYDDWRLPSAENLDGTGLCVTLTGCNLSEMGHLFYDELGNVAGLSNTGPFSGVVANNYWTSTYRTDPGSTSATSALLFGWYDGYQFSIAASGIAYAIVVRTGDVANELPQPGTLTLVLLGLPLLALHRMTLRASPAPNGSIGARPSV